MKYFLIHFIALFVKFDDSRLISNRNFHLIHLLILLIWLLHHLGKFLLGCCLSCKRDIIQFWFWLLLGRNWLTKWLLFVIWLGALLWPRILFYLSVGRSCHPQRWTTLLSQKGGIVLKFLIFKVLVEPLGML